MTGHPRESPTTRVPQIPHWLVVVALSFTLGCGARHTPPPQDAIDDPVLLLEATLTRLEALDAVRIRASLVYYGDGGRARIRQAVLAQRPSYVRMESISPFDTSMAVLILGDGYLIFYDIQEETYYRGHATPENIRRLAPLYFSPEDIVRVFLGAPPLDAVEPDPDTYTIEWNTRTAVYELGLPTVDGGSITVDIRHGDWTMAGARVYDGDGALRYELRTAGFSTYTHDGGDVVMPTRLRFLMSDRSVDLSMDVERIDINPELPETLFQLDPPRGATIVDL